ncbi:winged helix-turn-helix transcriptional regulator [Actinomycetospora aeridis]|uniref:Helix-turn-helix domain-containing protein n=1 Tax=Actinomycetospora aeridis TaxID=3129231 RepID=A0ABU8N2C5_9PSEU
MITDRNPALHRAARLVGRRWALEVVGVLAEGPHRFTDLRGELPGLSPSMLAARLRELTDAGVVRREHLPPPAGSSVYRLTERGAGLVPVVTALAVWGLTLDTLDTLDVPVRSIDGGRRAA